MISSSIKKGFTIVETLVAITILMVAIAGPLTVANKSYAAALDARNQTIAYNLAQYYIEYFNNYKDNEGWEMFKSFLQVTDNVDGAADGHIRITSIVEQINVPLTADIYWNLVAGNTNQMLVRVNINWKFGSVTSHVELQEVLSNSDIYPR